MWSRVALCFLVATAYASNGPAWKDNTEYVYTVRGRSLSSLENVSDQYSGIQIKSKLIITPKSSGMLQGRIMEPQYAQIHTDMPDGINQHIPDSELHYKQLPSSQKPFEMEMKDGYIRALIVEKDLKNWEVNMIKSIVSQFQLDVQGKQGISSPINIRGKQNNAVFKTMEETVTGETETLYEIHELPEYMIQAEPELVPVRHLRKEGEIIEVIKTQNYTNSWNRPAFYSGLKEVSEAEPTASVVENFLSRTSNTRAILTGKLSRFTIQSVSSMEKILVATSDNEREMGSVETVLNVTLAQVQTRSSQPQELSNPINAGRLVYRFLSSTYENEDQQNRSEESSEEGSSEENQWKSGERKRHPRSIRQQIRSSRLEESAEFLLAKEAFGISSQDDFVRKIKEITQQINEELKDSDKVLEKSTLSKYSFLTYLVAKINEQELKSVAEEIYSESQEQGKKDTWLIFRDAVAEAGSGPALLTIQHWIETKKIQHYEAGLILSTAAASAHTPTVEYMRKFYELIRSDHVASQSGVNETALLSYANLVNQVYVNKNVSHNQYPVHGFGKFRTQEGKKLMKETIIPYLSQRLDKAVHEADTRKIHVYIRALGNIGHKQILSAFEKYLEGDKQCSQFQRLMMVVSLDKLATSYPEIARAVLYRLYQNAGELQQIRVAAVYQIVRTNPPRELLQRMAIGTNFDKDQQVNAAVKSVIENLIELRSPCNENMRQAGEAAKHLLTKTSYGIQNYMLLKDYAVDEMQEEIMSTVQSMAQPESYWPNVLKFTVGKPISHLNQQYLSAEYMVSSIQELLNVLHEQTQGYHQQRSQRSQQGEQKQWSSAKIADLLKMELSQKEQLEGFIHTEMGVLSQVLSFNNRSIEQLPELIRQKLESLENGQRFRTTKMGHAKQISMVFPTIMGMQFYYKYDAPLLMKIEGQVKLSVTPQSSQHHKVAFPEEVSGHLESDITLSGKIEGQVGFATLFDHRRYMAGFTRNLQLSVPVKATYKFDLKNQQAQIELDKSVTDNRRAVHYSSWPFTTIWSLKEHSCEPTANRHIIKRDNQRTFETVFGQKSTGLAIKVWGNHPEQALNVGHLVQVIRSEGPMAAWEQLIKGTEMEQSEFNINLLPQQSDTQKITLRFGYKSQYFTSEGKKSERLSHWLKEDQSESSARLQKMMHLASSEVKSAKVHAVDALVTFQGQQKKQYSFTAGVGKSDANPRSNILAFFRKSLGEEWRQASVELRSEFKNTNGLDLVYSMENQPEGKMDYELLYKTNQEEKPTEIKGTIQLKRTEERKRYLVDQPEYEECKNERKQGNHQMEACAHMTIRANFFNKIEMEVQHQNLNKEVLRAVKEIYQGAQWYYLPSITVQHQRNEDDIIRMEVKFQPNFRAFNLSLQTSEEKLKIQDLLIDSELLRTVVKTHPVFHLRSRLFGKNVDSNKLTRSMCVLDKTAARTFDGLSYPVRSDDEWRVMMQYVPQQARYQQQSISQQLRNQVENYVVLVREQPEQQQKEVKIVFNTPATQGQEVEIDLKYNNGRVSVVKDGKQVDLSEDQSTDLVKGYVQSYKLPNQEVKIELHNAFYVIYDGQRVKLTATSDKLRQSVLGLCGNFDDDLLNEMQTPENCLVNDAKQLVESYKASQNRRSLEESQCISMERPRYVNVIRGEDAEQKYQHQYSSEDQQEEQQQQEGEIQLRQRYVEENGQICFTIRPVPSCKNDATETFSKEVPVHCVANPKQADYFKNQIQRGGNPDFSHKHVTKTVTMLVDRQCA